MSRNQPNQKRQPGSLKVWHEPNSNTVWVSADVHNGRVTRRVRGPQARDMQTALDLIKSNLNGETE